MPSLTCGIRNIAIFLAALAGTFAIIAHLAPFPDVPEVREKLRYLHRHRDEIDIIFVGSSRIRRQISPALFDKRLQAKGHSMRSYNLGIDAMTFPELPYLLDRVLALKMPRLRYVFIDLNPLRRKISEGYDENSLRAVYWHDIKHTAMVLRAIVHDPTPPSRGEAMRLAGAHLRMMCRNYSNLGRAATFLNRRLSYRRATAPQAREDDGFFPVAAALEGQALAAYNKELQVLKKVSRHPAPRDAVLEEALSACAHKIEKAGAMAIFVVAPTIGKTRPAWPPSSPFAGSRGGPLTFSFDDPIAEYELYEPRHRYDAQHLNEAGSLLFTERLADRFAEALREPRE